MPFLHEHRRRVPTQDYLCRIDVRVVSMSTGGADEARLVLATSAVHRAAREACARGVVGGHFGKRRGCRQGISCVAPNLDSFFLTNKLMYGCPKLYVITYCTVCCLHVRKAVDVESARCR